MQQRQPLQVDPHPRRGERGGAVGRVRGAARWRDRDVAQVTTASIGAKLTSPTSTVVPSTRDSRSSIIGPSTMGSAMRAATRTTSKASQEPPAWPAPRAHVSRFRFREVR